MTKIKTRHFWELLWILSVRDTLYSPPVVELGLIRLLQGVDVGVHVTVSKSLG